MRPFPHVNLVKKLIAASPAIGIKGVFADKCEAVATDRRARELAAIRSPRVFTKTATWKAFARGFLEGFGAIGLTFQRVAHPLPAYTPAMRDDSTAAAWHMTGHDLRCAIVMLMDAHNLDAKKIGFTDAEQQDLLACFDPETPSAEIYRAIRIAGSPKPAPAANAVPAPC